MTQNIALVGDSIFDNAGYVPGEPDVAKQLRCIMADDVDVTLLAVDGDFVGDVSRQLERLPPKTTHVFVSAGGNNALSYAQELLQQFDNAAEMFYEWSKIQKEFRSEYREMLAKLDALNRKAALCTIYDAVPSIDEIEATALSLFNDVIVSEAIAAGMPLVVELGVAFDVLVAMVLFGVFFFQIRERIDSLNVDRLNRLTETTEEDEAREGG